MNIMEEKPVDDLFDGLEGKKVRITVEVLEDTAGMMNLSARVQDDRRGDSDRHQKGKEGENLKVKWKCESCGRVLYEEREVMLERYVTCPWCGGAMIEVKEVSK